SVIWQIADRVLVLKNGEIVESGHTRTLFSNPTHPYTQSLLDAVPLPDPAKERERTARRMAGRVNQTHFTLNPCG
ncbi:MAG: microcin ABC transporter ATP-binding protein, partial [Granulosicoccus sp.]|nr:microcin ABC transporter ATP-binding protein [Granulosicoccus sp.]